MGNSLRGSRLLQRYGHRQHGGNQDNALPVDRPVRLLHIAQAAAQHHQDSSNQHRRHSRHPVKHHGRNHQQHNACGQGGLMRQGHLGGLRQRLAHYNPFKGFLTQARNIRPGSLNQQRISVLELHILQIMENVMVVSLDGQNIDPVLGAQPRRFHGHVDKVRVPHEQHFRNAYLVKLQFAFQQGIRIFRRLPVNHLRPIFPGKTGHVLKLSHYINDVAPGHPRI